MAQRQWRINGGGGGTRQSLAPGHTVSRGSQIIIFGFLIATCSTVAEVTADMYDTAFINVAVIL